MRLDQVDGAHRLRQLVQLGHGALNLNNNNAKLNNNNNNDHATLWLHQLADSSARPQTVTTPNRPSRRGSRELETYNL